MGKLKNLQWLISDYIGHLEHHLGQLFDLDAKNPELPSWQIGLLDAAQKLKANYEASKFITLMRHGSMSVELYAPEQVDYQQPHEQDELYVVEKGSGIFFSGGEQSPFSAGDVLFVKAGVEHRFEQFSEDFRCWVVFYGPKGGE